MVFIYIIIIFKSVLFLKLSIHCYAMSLSIYCPSHISPFSSVDTNLLLTLYVLKKEEFIIPLV